MTLGKRVLGGISDTAHSVGRVRIPEFLLFFFLVMYPMVVPGGLAFRFDAVILVVICIYAMFRRPQYSLGWFGAFIPLLAVAVPYLSLVSEANVDGGEVADWRTRLIRIMTVMAFVFMSSTGRVDLWSGALGWLTALIVNIPLYYAGLTTDLYAGFLTGVLEDKNVAGLAYALGLVMLPMIVRRWLFLLPLMSVFAMALWLTGSRTSMGGAAAGLVWIVVAPKIPLLARPFLAWLLYWGIGLVQEDFSQIGVFSDREGSDQLRARIDAASKIKVEETGFFGQGLGEAYAFVGEKAWFFHNSFWTLLVEGGWPWAVLIVAMTVVAMTPIWRKVETRDQAIVQGLGVVILVCSTRLGEVFITTAWGLVMALAIHAWISGRELTDPDSAQLDPRGRSDLPSGVIRHREWSENAP
ncbi:ABC transporter permease [Brachybacterium sp. EF45031]|uniref:ABC transporter permease n=1 Tax=Brachybacterium sillae TaxID=2810536 RepID=UPI00217E9D1B|nr:ABC transporter permease [Brachybacterium sillae]MCS6711638.1 ABC transporter permease [Brachybacterium sillae]